MVYTKQNFINGVALDATQLNAIEDGIVAAHNALEQKQPKGNYLTEVPDGYATEDFVKNKIAEAELSGGDVDLSGYATKGEIPTKTSQLTNDSGFLTEHQDLTDYAKKTDIPTIPVQSVNGKTGEVSIGASDVGADPSGTANSAVNAHNTSPDSHADIRELISELSGQNPSQSAGLTAEQIGALYDVIMVCTFKSDDVSAELNAFRTAFGISDPDGGDDGGSEGGDTGGSGGEDSGGGEETGGSNESTWTDGVAYAWENVMGAYVDNNNGAFVSYDGYSRTPYLACAGAEILRAEVVEQSSSMSRSNSSYNAFYDAERRFISAFTSVDTDAPAVGTYTDIAVPANAAFFVVSHKDNVMGATNAGIPYIRFIPYREVPV